ncbi:MAG: RNB domain-containing ribonuclease, partial [Gemmatimonadaceae bacterium]|nr:RNB domain-containing ribonuclease [Gemmatimonadaceae bacterium]
MTAFDLRAAARTVATEHGFVVDGADVTLAPIAAATLGAGARDLRALPWSSIDNDDTRDLDQLEASERLPDGGILVRLAIADVDVYVPKDSPLDQRAARNTTSVYT